MHTVYFVEESSKSPAKDKLVKVLHQIRIHLVKALQGDNMKEKVQERNTEETYHMAEATTEFHVEDRTLNPDILPKQEVDQFTEINNLEHFDGGIESEDFQAKGDGTELGADDFHPSDFKPDIFCDESGKRKTTKPFDVSKDTQNFSC